MARSGRGGGFLGALAGLLALAVVAFLVGALAGLVWKEPGLVVAYLRGDTTEIAWSSASQEEAPTPERAEAPSPPEPPAPAPAPARTAPPEPAPARPPAVAAAPPVARPAGHIAVQVGAFSAREAAEALRLRLEDAGFPAYLTAGAEAGDHWRVRVGPFPTREEAERAAGRLERERKLPTWVLDEDAE